MPLETPRRAALEAIRGVVASTISQHKMFKKGERILVAFSGGPDSTALAYLLTQLSYEVICGHVVHGMSPHSERNREVAERLAAEMGIELMIRSLEVPPRTEAEAREARYEALDAMAEESGATSIATGHTLDDEAETVLMRLQRGGLGLGIPPSRDNIFRPLRMLRREDTLRLCRSLGLSAFTDPTNSQVAFTRNLVRSQVLPAFEDDLVIKLAEIGDRSAQIIKNQPQAADAILEVSPDRAVLDLAELQKLGPDRGSGVVRSLLDGRLSVPASSAVISAVARKLSDPGSWSVDAGQGWTVRSEGSRLIVGRPESQEALEAFEVESPGRTHSESWGISVVVEEVDVPSDPVAGAVDAYIDAEAVSGRLGIRSRQEGDRFVPLGAPGTRKLQDVLVDAKIPRSARDRVPVLVDEEGIVWVVGVRVAESHKITEQTKRALHITVEGKLPGGWASSSMSSPAGDEDDD